MYILLVTLFVVAASAEVKVSEIFKKIYFCVKVNFLFHRILFYFSQFLDGESKFADQNFARFYNKQNFKDFDQADVSKV